MTLRAGRAVVTALALSLVSVHAVRGQSVVTSLTLFAGTRTGLWRSSDWGGSWQRVHGTTSGASLDSIGVVQAILPLGPQVWAAGEAGLFSSNDFGQTWVRENLSGAALAVLASRYFLAEPTIFVGTVDGLQKSGDGGHSFSPTPLRGTPVHRVEWPGPALLVATGRGVSFSEDSGKTFTEAGAGLPAGGVRALATSSFYAVDPVLFAGTDGAGVFRSSDGGKTWSAAGLGGRGVRDLVWFGPHLYAATDAGLFRSDDLGRSWQTLGKQMQEKSISRLMFPLAPQSGSELFAATDHGLFRSSSGGEYWESAGLRDEDVLTVATFPPPAPVTRKGRRK